MLGPYRFIPVIALLGAAAALATPRGRLPLALRGLKKTLQGDAGRADSAAQSEPVAGWRKCAAFLLVVAAFLVAVLCG